MRSVATGSTSAASSQVTIPVPAGVLANDVMIAQVTVRGGSGITLTAPAGWSLVRRDNDGGGQIADGIYLQVVRGASEPTSYAWTFSAGNDAAGGIAAYSGVNKRGSDRRHQRTGQRFFNQHDGAVSHDPGRT